MTANESSILKIYFSLPVEPLVVSVSVLNHVICNNWGTFQRKVGASSREIAGKLCQLLALIENPDIIEKSAYKVHLW